LKHLRAKKKEATTRNSNQSCPLLILSMVISVDRFLLHCVCCWCVVFNEALALFGFLISPRCGVQWRQRPHLLLHQFPNLAPVSSVSPHVRLVSPFVLEARSCEPSTYLCRAWGKHSTRAAHEQRHNMRKRNKIPETVRHDLLVRRCVP